MDRLIFHIHGCMNDFGFGEDRCGRGRICFGGKTVGKIDFGHNIKKRNVGGRIVIYVINALNSI